MDYCTGLVKNELQRGGGHKDYEILGLRDFMGLT